MGENMKKTDRVSYMESPPKSSCKEVLDLIGALEDEVGDTSIEIDCRAVHLVNLQGKRNKEDKSSNRVDKECVTAVKQNWKWILGTLQCAEVHARNAADYHEFFYEAEEAKNGMDFTLSNIHSTFDICNLDGDRSDIVAVMNEIKTVLMGYLQWQTTVDNLRTRSGILVPVQKRLKKISHSCQVTALVDFHSKEISFSEGDSLSLVDNTNRKLWQVRTSKGQVGNIPSLLLLIPGPSDLAMEEVRKLYHQLLVLWTASLKRLEFLIFSVILRLFRDWTPEEIQAFQAMPSPVKEELLGFLKCLESNSFKKWADYSQFKKLEEKVSELKNIISKDVDQSTIDKSNMKTVVIQVQLLEKLLGKYQDFSDYWSTFKSFVETRYQRENLIVFDREKFKYLASAYFVKFLDGESKSDKISSTVRGKELEKKQVSLVLHEKCKSDMKPKKLTAEEQEMMMATEYEETITDEVQTSIEEEEYTFVITGVVDPLRGKKFDLQEAVDRGILNQTTNTFYNTLTRKNIPVSQAMNEGLVTVEVVSKKKIREEKKEFGLITVKHTRERPYNIVSVRDPSTNKMLTVTQAADKKVINMTDSTYRTKSGEQIPISNAIESGLVEVEYHKVDSGRELIDSKTYSVTSVVDQKTRSKVSFREALRLGILDGDTGEYTNNVTKEKFNVTDAISKGYIKGRQVTDDKSFNIEAENKIVVEKRSNMKTKLSAVNAFKHSKH